MIESNRLVDDSALSTVPLSARGPAEMPPSEESGCLPPTPVQVPNGASPQFAILSGDGRISSVCQSVNGTNDLGLIGSHFEILFALDSRHLRLPSAVLERARRTGSAAIDGKFLRSDGSEYRARCTLVTLRGDEGRTRGFVMAMHTLDEDAHEYRRITYPLLRDPAPRSLFGRALLGVVYLAIAALEGTVAYISGARH